MRYVIAVLIAGCLAVAGLARAGSFPDGPGGPNIAVINTSEVSQTALQRFLPYFQQYADQVCAAWHCTSHLYLASKPATGSDWTLTLNNVSDNAGAIGYHQASKTGVPAGFVSVQTAIANGIHWGVVFTHELAEMLGDPTASFAANTDCQARDSQSGAPANCTFYALELCDPVQGESYRLGPVTVSDFVYRSWFVRGSPGPYDAGRHLSSPLTLAAGSYMVFYKDGLYQRAFTFGARDWETGLLMRR